MSIKDFFIVYLCIMSILAAVPLIEGITEIWNALSSLIVARISYKIAQLQERMQKLGVESSGKSSLAAIGFSIDSSDDLLDEDDD